MRSRLWSLILKELPFPFRQIGTEVAQILRWLDHSAARVLVGWKTSPGWYFVTTAGTVTVMLTLLLFFPYIASHDPTLGELVNDSTSAARVTRSSLEAAGDWSVQDKWRLAHLFVDHRPPRSLPAAPLDSQLFEEQEIEVAHLRRVRLPGGRWQEREVWEREIVVVPVNTTPKRDPEVRLETARPNLAAQAQRLVFNKLAGSSTRDVSSLRRPLRYGTRDTRLLVQTEFSFDPDCVNGFETTRRTPTRRLIPTPDPRWDEPEPPVVVRDERRPDLSFQMELLREFLPVTGEFPPRSREISVAARSEFPSNSESSRRSHRLAQLSDEWVRSTSTVEHHPLPEAYISRVHPGTETVDTVAASELDEEDGPLDSFAEVALRLELYAPETVLAGRLHESSLRVVNEGPSPVSLVRVRESLAELETVTDAIPDARINHDMLERDVRNLAPRRERQLGVTWLPNSEGARVHRAAVTMHAAVGVTTNVVPPEPPAVEQPQPAAEPEPMSEPMREPEPAAELHPAIDCAVKHVERATVGDMVELEIVVNNTGDTALTDVRIFVEVPAELKHRQGAEVEYEVGSLPRRGSRKATLRLLADAPGKATCRVHALAHEDVEAKARAVIEVAAKPAPRAPESPRPAPKPAPKPAAKPLPIPTSGNCCCPGQPIAAILDPWFLP